MYIVAKNGNNINTEVENKYEKVISRQKAFKKGHHRFPG